MMINFDGEVYPEDKCFLSVNNRGLKYGDGLFETIRVFNGKVPFLHAHFLRLLRGLEMLQMDIPTGFTPVFLKREILKIIESPGNASARLTVFRGGSGKYLPKENWFHFFIECGHLSSNRFQLNDKGLNLAFFEDHLLCFSPVSSLKTCNSIPYILASLFFKNKELDDALLLNDHQRIAEGTSSNIFMVKNDQITTPPLSEGCVAGTTREIILTLCEKLKISCQEKPVTPEMLLNADEVFLTNAISGIRWVGKVAERSYFQNKIAVILLDMLNKIVDRN